MEAGGRLKTFEDMYDKYSQQSVYERKHTVMEKKCWELREENEKLMHRLHEVKALVRQYAEEQQLIMSKLDEYSDNYQEVLGTLLSQEETSHAGIVVARPADAVAAPASAVRRGMTKKAGRIAKHQKTVAT